MKQNILQLLTLQQKKTQYHIYCNFTQEKEYGYLIIHNS